MLFVHVTPASWLVYMNPYRTAATSLCACIHAQKHVGVSINNSSVVVSNNKNTLRVTNNPSGDRAINNPRMRRAESAPTGRRHTTPSPRPAPMRHAKSLVRKRGRIRFAVYKRIRVRGAYTHQDSCHARTHSKGWSTGIIADQFPPRKLPTLWRSPCLCATPENSVTDCLRCLHA